MPYIPKGFWRAANNLRLYIRAKEPDRMVPTELDDCIEHFESLAHAALQVDDAHKTLERRRAALNGYDPRKVAPNMLGKIRHAEAELSEALDELSRLMKDPGPGVSKKSKKQASGEK